MTIETTQFNVLFRQQAEDFGNWLRQQREEKEMSQPDFASRIGLTDRAQLIKIEKGRTQVTRERAVRIAEALELPVREVLKRAGYVVGEDDMPPELARFNELSETYKGLVVKQIVMFHRAQQSER